MEKVKEALSRAGQKLHTHEIHVRRTANKGYIARHDLRNEQGQPPSDGQNPDAEYSLADFPALQAHLQEHMGGEGAGEPEGDGDGDEG